MTVSSSLLHTERPYSEKQGLRLAVWSALAMLGVFLLSVPAWAFDSLKEPTWTAILGGGGGVLLGFGLGAIVNERLDPTHAAVQEAINLQADPAIAGNLRSAIREEVSLALAEVASSSVDFGPRANLFERLKFEHTNNQVIIQSISLSSKWQIAQLLERLLLDNKEATAKLLLVHPYSTQARLRDAGPNLPNGNDSSAGRRDDGPAHQRGVEARQ